LPGTEDKQFRRGLLELGVTSRVSAEKVVAIVEMFNDGKTVNYIRVGKGAKHLQSLGLGSTNKALLDNIVNNLAAFNTVLTQNDAFKLASISDEAETTRLMQGKEWSMEFVADIPPSDEDQNISISPIDARRKELGVDDLITSRNDPDAVQRLEDMQEAESLVRKEWISVQHLENIGYATKEALVFIEEYYRLNASRYYADHKGSKDFPHRLGYFRGFEKLLEMNFTLSQKSVNPSEPVAHRVENGESVMPDYILRTAGKLFVEGMVQHERRMVAAATGLTAFCIWRSPIHIGELDHKQVWDMNNPKDVDLIRAFRDRNIFMDHYFDALREYSHDNLHHNNFIDHVKNMLSQELALDIQEV